MIGMIISVIALSIIAAAEVYMYISLTRAIRKLPEPRRKIQRTLYGRNWPRIMEMTKIEKGGKRK